MDSFLDIFYGMIHAIVVFMNLFFWIFKRTRKIHFYLINITAFSWFVLGFKFGIGYCFLTDWHWDVKERLGYQNLPNNFISYGLERYFSVNLTELTVNYITGGCFIFCFLVAWFLRFYQKNNI